VRLLVVGGKLQGTEACYLAAAAGYETVLVDRREAPPAAGLAGRHVIADITADETLARSLVRSCDAVLPACEDLATLEWLAARVPAWDVPLLFDLEAYRVTESKSASRRLFGELRVPLPRPWPACGLPAVVKPDASSGSEGVSVHWDERGVAAAVRALEDGGHAAVVEEYVPGPSLSLEVLCWDGRAVPLQVTGLEFDEVYDCKRVVAPVEGVSDAALGAFDDVTVRLAEGLGLRGLMDVEVMVAGDAPRVLEIDARLPSQTPTAVYWSSGLNILEALAATVRGEALPAIDRTPRRACVYQHVSVRDGELRVVGEHVMGSAPPLARVSGFFGVDEALTDYQGGARSWVATLIAAGDTVDDARRRVDDAVRAAAAQEGLHVVPEAGAEADEGGRR
jgi:pyrrolysine biosynthesis protein PylC